MSNRTFTCPKCDTQPEAAFSIFEKSQGWCIAYPDESLIHIHFGGSTDNETDNIDEAHFLAAFIKTVTQNNPDTHFFSIIDFSHIDNSEFIPTDSFNVFKNIFENRQIEKTVIYGLTFELGVLLSGFIKNIDKDISVAKNYLEAVEVYDTWNSK